MQANSQFVHPNPNYIIPTAYQHPAQFIHSQDQINQHQLRQTFNTVYTLQNQIELGSLIQVLASQQIDIQKEIDAACGIGYPNQYAQSKDESDFIHQKCIAIKNKNQSLLIRLLNLREKMVQKMYIYKENNQFLQHQMNSIQEKIREVKAQISNKVNTLKIHKSNSPNSSPLQKQFGPIKIALVELKDATEVLEKEVVEKKIQLNFIIKHLHGHQL